MGKRYSDKVLWIVERQLRARGAGAPNRPSPGLLTIGLDIMLHRCCHDSCLFALNTDAKTFHRLRKINHPKSVLGRFISVNKYP